MRNRSYFLASVFLLGSCDRTADNQALANLVQPLVLKATALKLTKAGKSSAPIRTMVQSSAATLSGSKGSLAGPTLPTMRLIAARTSGVDNQRAAWQYEAWHLPPLQADRSF